MKRSLIVLAVASLVFAGVASAEVKKGDIFLDFGASWVQQNYADAAGGNDTTYSGLLRPGIALTDNIRVAAIGAVSYADLRDGDKTTGWDLGVSGEYVFMPANQFNPYVGAQLAWSSERKEPAVGAATTVDGWIWGPRAGVLFTLNKTNNLFGEFQYNMREGDLSNTIDKEYAVLFGIEHKFKTGQ